MELFLLLIVITVLSHHVNLSVALNVEDGLLPNFNGYPTWVSKADRNVLLSGRKIPPAMIVAQDGSGQYRTIGEAVQAMAEIRKTTNHHLIVHVKKGVYNEHVDIKLNNVVFIGDGIDATIVTGHERFLTVQSPTFTVKGHGFIAMDMTFENTLGPLEHQAVALMSSSDSSIFYRCSFKGYQDTLYVHKYSQFYRNCDIYGTMDFIYGNAAVLFQYCNIYLRKPMPGLNWNCITAQGRSSPNERTGIVIQYSKITATPELQAVQNAVASYLGRPWKQYSRTVIMQCEIDSVITPMGWTVYRPSFALSTLFYAEYDNFGPGSDTTNRVKWPGVHIIKSPQEAQSISVESLFGWN